MTQRLREVNSWLKMHRIPPLISNSKSNRNNLPKRTITKKITRLHHKAVETKIKIMTIIDGINNSLPVAEDVIVMDEAALTSRMNLLETATITTRNAAAEATIEVVVVVGVAITRASSRISSEGIDVEVAMVVVVAEAVVATQMTTNART